MFAITLPWTGTYVDLASLGAVTLGAAILVMGVLILLRAVAMRGRILTEPDRRLALADTVTDAIVVALGIRFVGSLAVAFATFPYDFVIFSDGLSQGLTMGIGTATLVTIAAGLIVRYQRGIIASLSLGVLVAMAAFRLIFGPTAGLGPSTGMGVGPDMGILFGLLGGLIGAIVGLARQRNPRSPSAGPPQSHLDRGMAAGAIIGLVVALAGWAGGFFSFILPLYAGLTECYTQPQCSLPHPTIAPDLYAVLGVVYGLSLVMMLGMLLGGLGVTLAEAWSSSRWVSSGAALALVTALASGLSFGMQHRFVGGPPPELPPPVSDPRAGGIGLAIGAAAGMLIGVGTLLLRRQSVRHPMARGAATAGIGVTLLTMPLWLTPLLGISGP